MITSTHMMRTYQNIAAKVMLNKFNYNQMLNVQTFIIRLYRAKEIFG